MKDLAVIWRESNKFKKKDLTLYQ